MRYHNGMYYVTTFAQTTGKTYIFTTKDIEKGPLEVVSFKPSFHDHSLFFDDDGKVYLIYGGRKTKIVELNEDLTGVKARRSGESAHRKRQCTMQEKKWALAAEGSQLFKVNGKYYLFNICGHAVECEQ